MRSEAFRWWPAWLLVAGGLLALGTRLVDRDLQSYVLDEPQLQDAATHNPTARTRGGACDRRASTQASTHAAPVRNSPAAPIPASGRGPATRCTAV